MWGYAGMNEKLEYLEDERKKLWAAVIGLRDAVSILQSESQFKDREDEESAIRRLGLKASRAYNGLIQKVPAVEDALKKLTEALGSAQENSTTVTNLRKKIDEDKAAIESDCIALRTFLSECESREKEILARLDSADNAAKQGSDLAEKLQETEDDIATKQDILLKQVEEIEEKYKEVVSAHKSVLGYIDSTGTRVEGKKHDLDVAYDNLLSDMRKLKEEAAKQNADARQENSDFLEAAKADEQLIVAKLKALLPNCLTAGLSSAYLKARKKEEWAQVFGLTFFALIIGLMLVIAAVPAGLGFYLRFKCNWTEQDVLAAFPRFVLGAIPFYFPLLWIAIFVNRRVNLSKRLVEEYKHKEVVSKTFEGLSTQISKLEDDKVSKELQAKLLYNTVCLSEKNPGELMKNFHRADNPLMDVLEHGSKMSELIDKLASVPGLSRALNLVGKRSEQIKKLNDAVETVEAVATAES